MVTGWCALDTIVGFYLLIHIFHSDDLSSVLHKCEMLKNKMVLVYYTIHFFFFLLTFALQQ